jgi:hypothetical protein
VSCDAADRLMRSMTDFIGAAMIVFVVLLALTVLASP